MAKYPRHPDLSVALRTSVVPVGTPPYIRYGGDPTEEEALHSPALVSILGLWINQWISHFWGPGSMSIGDFLNRPAHRPCTTLAQELQEASSSPAFAKNLPTDSIVAMAPVIARTSL